VPRYRVTNLTRNTLLADRARRADTFAGRLLGLMGRSTLPVGEGLWLTPSTGIHTFFMRLPIDALVLDASLAVIEVYAVLVPWRVSRMHRGALGVLELPAGIAEASGTRPGDRLGFTAVEGALSTAGPKGSFTPGRTAG
jgi:uncharacterized protein